MNKKKRYERINRRKQAKQLNVHKSNKALVATSERIKERKSGERGRERDGLMNKYTLGNSSRSNVTDIRQSRPRERAISCGVHLLKAVRYRAPRSIRFKRRPYSRPRYKRARAHDHTDARTPSECGSSTHRESERLYPSLSFFLPHYGSDASHSCFIRASRAPLPVRGHPRRPLSRPPSVATNPAASNDVILRRRRL